MRYHVTVYDEQTQEVVRRHGFYFEWMARLYTWLYTTAFKKGWID
jgi:hypothetical protein